MTRTLQTKRDTAKNSQRIDLMITVLRKDIIEAIEMIGTTMTAMIAMTEITEIMRKRIRKKSSMWQRTVITRKKLKKRRKLLIRRINLTTAKRKRSSTIPITLSVFLPDDFYNQCVLETFSFYFLREHVF